MLTWDTVAIETNELKDGEFGKVTEHSGPSNLTGSPVYRNAGQLILLDSPANRWTDADAAGCKVFRLLRDGEPLIK